MNQENSNRYYFAYGSNLNLEQMQYRCKTARVVGSSILKNYRLSFHGKRPNYSFLTIEKKENYIVPIGIFLITDSDEKRLDTYEGYPTFYNKQNIKVLFNEEEIIGLIYIMRSKFREYPPHSSYYYTCFQGYKDFKFDTTPLEEALVHSINPPKKLTKTKTDTKH